MSSEQNRSLISRGAQAPRVAVNVRKARREDLPAIVELFDQDEVYRDASPPSSQEGVISAFEVIASDPNNHVFVAEIADPTSAEAAIAGSVVGTFQLTLIRQLTFGGCLVAQVESVFVHPKLRSRGIGTAMMNWAMDQARVHGCIRVQLTSNEARVDAHRFYEAMGFRATHRGMKLTLV